MKYILFFLYTLFLYLIISFFTVEWRFLIPIFLSGVFFSVYYMLRLKVNINKYFVWFSFSGFILFITLIGIAKFDKSFLFILLTPIASYFGYLFFNATSYKRKIGIILLLLVCSIFSATYIHSTVFYYLNKREIIVNDINIDMFLANGEKIKLDKEKVYIFDLWSTSCGACIEKFPEFSKLCNIYKSNDGVEFYAVNVALARDKAEDINSFVLNKGFCFDNLYISSLSEAEKIGVDKYPAIIIVKENKIIYNGNPSYDNYILFNNIYDLIDEHIN